MGKNIRQREIHTGVTLSVDGLHSFGAPTRNKAVLINPLPHVLLMGIEHATNVQTPQGKTHVNEQNISAFYILHANITSWSEHASD